MIGIIRERRERFRQTYQEKECHLKKETDNQSYAATSQGAFETNGSCKDTLLGLWRDMALLALLFYTSDLQIMSEHFFCFKLPILG